MNSRMRWSTTNAGVPFVQVPDAPASIPSARRTRDAADPEDDLLLDARFAIAAVQPRRQLTIPRRVFLEIGVEQDRA